MNAGRSALYAAVAAAVLVAALVAGLSLRDRGQVTTTPPPATASPTTTSPGVVAPSPSPTATTARYVSATLGYSIDTPPPWRRSTCTSSSPDLSGRGPSQGGVFMAIDEFVPVSARDETGSDVGVRYATVRVFVEDNPERLTPRQWAEQGRTIGSFAGQQIDDVTYAGRPAARRSEPGSALAAYVVANGARMYAIAPMPGPTTPDAATADALSRIVGSFRFLTDAELAAARAAATATPLPPRAPEALADGLAAAFAAKDVDAIASYLAPCVTIGAENAGASFVSRERYLDDLRAAFAAGLSVTVRARPFEGDRAAGALTIGSTWTDQRDTRERKLMLRRGENDRWEWHGTLERFQ